MNKKYTLIGIIISVSYLFLYQLVFLNIDEIFPHAYGIGLVINGITFSIAASLIFYMVVNVIPLEKRTHKINRYLFNKIRYIIQSTKRLMISIISYDNSKTINEQISTFPISDNMIIECKKISEISTGSTPKNYDESLISGNWIEYLENYISRTSSIINKILALQEYLPDSIVEDLLNIEETNLFSNRGKHFEYKNREKIDFLGNNLQEYLQQIRKLQNDFKKIEEA